MTYFGCSRFSSNNLYCVMSQSLQPLECPNLESPQTTILFVIMSPRYYTSSFITFSLSSSPSLSLSTIFILLPPLVSSLLCRLVKSSSKTWQGLGLGEMHFCAGFENFFFWKKANCWIKHAPEPGHCSHLQYSFSVGQPEPPWCYQLSLCRGDIIGWGGIMNLRYCCLPQLSYSF